MGAASGPMYEGARLFHAESCLNCHRIGRYGGRRGPDLTYVADRLTQEQIILRIPNGGVNMPAFAGSLSPAELSALVAFLESRTSHGSATGTEPKP